MIARYLPPDAAQPLDSTVTSPEELDALLAEATSLAGRRSIDMLSIDARK
jgi:hypothetical protein